MGDLLRTLYENFRDDLFLIVVVTAGAIVRAMGVTIESGWTGLRFSFGRAGNVLDPGFHPLFPFVQKVKRLPTRSRTLDLPAQRVATVQGLVYHVDANLVYRIVDVRRALIQIDQLEKGMIQMLGLGVQEVLRRSSHERIVGGDGLDDELAAHLGERLAPWGVAVERAGLPSITPSPQSLRITQLSAILGERRSTLRRLEDGGVRRRKALCLVGARHMPRPRRRVLIRRTRVRNRMLRLRAAMLRRGWTAIDVKRARIRLRSRLLVRGAGARK